MKLLKLEFQAFGPFKNKEIIDFTLFNTNSLFLVSGKTGSGKTTIFDAISYALFGKTTGEYKKDDALRSQYATNDIETYVSLVFEANNHKYEVKRSPSYIKIGNKSKTNPINTLVDLESNTLLESKLREVNQKVETIIGFKYEQFKQIVVLPQGEFMKILNSKADEKEKLFSIVLNSDIYTSITNKIKEDNSISLAKVETKTNYLVSILRKYNVENIEKLDLYKTELKEKHQGIQNKYDSLTKELEELKLKRNDIASNNDLLTKYNKYIKELDNLKLSEEEININFNKIKELNLINSISNSVLNKDNYTLELTNNNTKIEEYTKSNLLINKDNKEVNELISEKNTINNELKSLDKKIIELTNDLSSYNTYISNLKVLEDTKNTLNLELSINTDKEKDITIKINDLLKQEALYNDYIINYSSKKLNELESIKAIVETNLANQTKIEELNSKINIDNTTVINLTNTLTSLNELKITKEKLFDLTELAKYKHLLVDNQECPLCGSIHHPKVIESNLNITKEEIDSLNKDILNKTNELNRLNSNILLNSNLIENYNSYINKDYLNIDLNKLENDILEEETKAKTYTEYKQKLIKVRTELDIINLSKVELDNKLNTTNNKILENNTKIDNINNEISKLNNKYQDISKIEFLLEDLKTKYKNLDNNYKELEITTNKIITNNTNILNLKDRNIELKSKIEELNQNISTFEETNNIKACIFTKDDAKLLEELNNKVDTYNNSLLTLNTGIKTLKDSIKSFEFILLEPYDLKINELTLLVNTLKNEYETSLTTLNQCNNDYKEYQKIEKENESNIKNHEMINQLYRLVSGQIPGSNKTTLQNYVLGKLLDEILVYSNIYLENFTDKRYSLKRDEVSSQSKGLDLLVFDTYTSLTRSVSSLSGGETFMSCLALALGMSEYISNIYGGISLENIFIDEGFGTLDSESLDKAIETLIELSCNGKTVGIISHVEELKQRINQIIEVKKTKTGSTINLM